MEFSFKDNSAEIIKILDAIQQGLRPSRLDPVVDRTAQKVLEMLKEATPKGFTGQLRNAWQIDTPETAKRFLFNPITVNTKSRGRITLIELLATGTGVYGPAKAPIKPVRAKRLYVPLTRRASFGWTQGLKYGQDYVLAKQVKGFRTNKSRRPVEVVEPKAEKLLERNISKHVNDIIKATR